MSLRYFMYMNEVPIVDWLKTQSNNYFGCIMHVMQGNWFLLEITEGAKLGTFCSHK